MTQTAGATSRSGGAAGHFPLPGMADQRVSHAPVTGVHLSARPAAFAMFAMPLSQYIGCQRITHKRGNVEAKMRVGRYGGPIHKRPDRFASFACTCWSSHCGRSGW